MFAFAFHFVEKAGFEHDIQHGIADRAGERIAAIGRAVCANCHTLRSFSCGEAGGRAGSRCRWLWRRS